MDKSNMAYVAKNFFNYEDIHPVPQLVPGNLVTMYLTDSEQNKQKALSLGWDRAYVDESLLNINDHLKRRVSISHINCYPERHILELSNFDKAFITDSNIIRIDSAFSDFIIQCSEQYTLYGIKHSWYHGDGDNISSEMRRSYQQRWAYNWSQMQDNTNRYIEIFKEMGMDYMKIPVMNIKYMGWNMKKKQENKIADLLWEEYNKHLQGNIILSYLWATNQGDVFNYCGFRNDEALVHHKFEA